MAKAKTKGRNIVDEIYFSFQERGKHWINRYGLDLGANGVMFDPTTTSGNLDFQLRTSQTCSENVYLFASLYDYERKETHQIGYFYFKDNNGRVSKEMMMFAADIIEKGNEITEEIFEEVS